MAVLDVAIIDYKISNMFSVCSASDHCGLQAKITGDRDEILNARAAILPGVGTFGSAMSHLQDLGLVPVVKEFIATGKPFMGICLGLQLLMDDSEEFGLHKGLGIIPGTVRKFPRGDGNGGQYRVPHIGWNALQPGVAESRWPVKPMNGINPGEYVYFVHSYYVSPADESVVLTRTNYAGINFCSSLAWDNIFACQFHPEKSGREGLKIFKNFADSVKNNGKVNKGEV